MRHLAIGLVLCFVVSGLMSLPQVTCAAVSQPTSGVEGDSNAAKDTKNEKKKSGKKRKDKKAKQEAAEKAAQDKKQEDKKAVAKPDDKKAAAKKEEAKKAEPQKDEAKKDAPPAKAAPAKTAAASAPKPPVHEVEKGPFRVTVDLKGTFEARKTAEVSVWPEQWSSFTVLKAVDHGKQVKQGDLLIAFDPEKIDEALDELRHQIKLNDLSMRGLQEEMASLEKLVPMDMKAIERQQRIAKEDYELMKKVDLPTYKENAALSLKSAEESLAYDREELEQLEKMYKADELTDETEEIILRRARFQVARSEFYFKLAKQRYDETMKFSLPRTVESIEDSITRTTMSNKKAKILLPLTLKKSRLNWEKAKLARDELNKKLKELVEDRKLMTIKSPAAGIVYYGESDNGRWTGLTSDKSFRPRASVPPKQVIMTIVQPGPLLVQSAASEKEIRYVHDGLKGKVQPTAYPDTRLDAVVAEVAAVPNGANQFPAKLMITDQNGVNVMPGMTCTIKLVAYEKKNALTIPPTALGTEPLDETKYFVHVVDKDGESKKRTVKVGERTDAEVEILAGLKAGDKILKTCPKEAAKKKAEEAKKKEEEAKKPADAAKSKVEKKDEKKDAAKKTETKK